MSCTCPFCAALLVYADNQAWQIAPCPGCKRPFRLPAEEMPWENFRNHLNRVRRASEVAVAQLQKATAGRKEFAGTFCARATETATEWPG